MKAHMKVSDAPLADGVQIVAACGDTVPNARFVFMMDKGFTALESLNTLHFCAECLKAELKGRYLYGIVNGQESLYGV